MAIPRIAVLISGRGSNLAALLAADSAGTLSGAVSAVVSNRPDAAGLQVAAKHAVATAVVDHRSFSSRDAFDAALAAVIDASEPQLIVMAGFMRIVGSAFIERYAGRMLNIHPSLLPSYTGQHTHRRALADGVRIHGCTVHFVTADVDRGPIVAQGAVAVRHDDDEATLAARVLQVEHRLLPRAVAAFCDGRLVIAGGRVHVESTSTPVEPLLVPFFAM